MRDLTASPKVLHVFVVTPLSGVGLLAVGHVLAHVI